MDIDDDARNTAFKVLIVIFIIFTIATNLELLLRCFRVRAVLNHPNHCIKVTLALGSIFLALFFYVVEARRYFDDTDSMTCRTFLTSNVYFMFFFPFVFGCGVCVMAMCLYLSQSRYQNILTTWNPKVKSLLVAAVPWLLAVVLICPLTLAGTDWDYHCDWDFPLSRYRAMTIISMVIPACLALLFSIFISYKTYPANNGTSIGTQHSVNMPQVPIGMISTTSNPTQPTGVENTCPPPYGDHSSSNYQQQGPRTQQNPQQNPQQSPQQCPQQYPQQNPQQNPQQYPQQYPQQNSQQNTQQYPQQYPQQNPQQYPQQYPQQNPQQYPQQYPHQYSLIPGSAEVAPLDFMKEKRCLVLVSLIFFFSVMPFSIYFLGYTLNPDRIGIHQSTLTIITDILTWIFHLYPALVPLVWRFTVSQ